MLPNRNFDERMTISFPTAAKRADVFGAFVAGGDGERKIGSLAAAESSGVAFVLAHFWKMAARNRTNRKSDEIWFFSGMAEGNEGAKVSRFVCLKGCKWAERARSTKRRKR